MTATFGKAVVTARTYELPLSDADFLLVMKGDSRYEPLHEILMDLGALDPEYDGHFGSAIFFILGADEEDKLPVIEEAVREYVEDMRALALGQGGTDG